MEVKKNDESTPLPQASGQGYKANISAEIIFLRQIMTFPCPAVDFFGQLLPEGQRWQIFERHA